jgi:hypothetical protein
LRFFGLKRFGSELFGDAEIFFALGHPSADLAEELAPLDQVLVRFGELLNISDIFQITEVVLVIRMRHLVLFHVFPLSCLTVSDILIVDYVGKFV